MFNYRREQGFTLIELLVVLVVLSILLSVSVVLINDPNGIREAEVKANLKVIQTAIERYSVDHDRYPSFLLGGDSRGWSHWHLVNDELDPPSDKPSNNLVSDPLIMGGYLASYPQNPFVDDGMRIIMSTCARGSGPNGALRFGDGDPRFGFMGNIMGNGLDDPVFYKHRTSGIPPVNTSLVETSRTLSSETVKKLGFCEPPDGLHYMMGGRKGFDDKGNVITIATFWPGNFLYRGLFYGPLGG